MKGFEAWDRCTAKATELTMNDGVVRCHPETVRMVMLELCEEARRAAIEECAAALEEQADVDAHCQKSAMGYPGPKYTISEASAILLPQWAAEIRRLAEEGGGA